MRAASPATRAASRAVVLREVRRSQPISRAEIARRSGLSEGTVSRLVAELLDARVLAEAGSETYTGGRPGTSLLLDPAYYRSIGVEILNWETRVSVGTLRGRAAEGVSFRTPAAPDEALELVASHCAEICANIDPESLQGVGIAVRGVVDHESGVVRLGNMRGWQDVAVRDFLEQRLNVPVYVENDVRAAALAEYNSGNPDIEGNRCLLFVRIDEGIGVAIVIDGGLYRGRHMAAGEFGQMAAGDPARHGSLESLAANPALCERYAELTESARRPRVAETSGRARAICREAMQGSAAARQAVTECCRFLGLGIANLVWILDPDMVVIDGAITSAWQAALAAIMEEMAACELPHLRDLIIRPGALGVDAALCGAILLPFGPLFATGERAGRRSPEDHNANALA